jgi:plastocyanin
MSHRWTTAPAVAALAAVLAACGGGNATKPAETAGSKGAAQDPSSAPVQVASGRMTVDMRDYRFAPADLTAPAGKLTITAANKGRQQHELVLLRTDKAPVAIPVKSGKASESYSVGEIAEQDPGTSGTHTFKLAAGKYVFICNVDGHYALGMRGSLLVK